MYGKRKRNTERNQEKEVMDMESTKCRSQASKEWDVYNKPHSQGCQEHLHIETKWYLNI